MVKIVTYYRYLGLIFFEGFKFHTENNLKARIPKYNRSFQIFDSRIPPILLDGAKIWGSERRNQIENIHLRFCKFVL